jgi:phospholipase/carboxylesterase
MRARTRHGLLGLALLLACGQAPASEPRPLARPLDHAPADRPQQPAPPAPSAPLAPVSPASTAAHAANTPADRYRQLAGVEYVELITGGAAAEDRLPLILAIHGLGDRPERFAALLRPFPIPARIILPRAFDAVEDGFSWFPIRARSKDIDGLAAGIAGAADRLAPFLAAITTKRPTRGKPIVTGFSQGGMLSFALAVRFPQEISAAAPIGGWLPPPLWPTTPPPERRLPPITAFHGDADNAVKIEPTRAAVQHLVGLGYPVELREYPGVAHEIPAQLRADLYRTLTAALAAQEPPR